jgi:PAS domain S-box-containing protein
MAVNTAGDAFSSQTNQISIGLNELMPLLASFAQAIWETDARGQVVTDSPSWRAYTGQTLEQWRAEGWVGAIHPDDRDEARRLWQEAVRAQAPVDATFRLNSADGSWRWTNLRATAIAGADGLVSKWLGMIIDITQQKNVEQLAEAVLDGSLSYVQVFNAVRDHQDNIIDFRWRLTNQKWNQDYGDVIGKSLLEQNPAVVETGIFERFIEVIKTGQPQQHEHHYVHEQFDGWFYQSIVKLEDGIILTTRNVTDRKQAEQQVLRLQQELTQLAIDKYQSIFNAINEGFGIAEILVDEHEHGIDFRWLEVNDQFESQTGLERAEVLSGKTMRQVSPELEESWFETYGQVARTGESQRFEAYSGLLNRWFSVYTFRIGAPELRQVAIQFTNITERKRVEETLRQNEARQAFLVRLSDALRSRTDLIQIQNEACRLLGEYLDAQRVSYADIEGDEFIIRCSYTRGVAPITGRGAIATFSHALLEAYRRHGAVAINDVATNPHFDERDRANYAKADIAATVSVMLIKNDQWVASFAAHSSTPRQWTTDELALVRETAERIWTSVDRARAETALRESEIKYRMLFNSIDEGYYLLEVIFDELGEAIDVLYLDANPAAIRMSGEDRRGKRLRDVGNYEPYWYELYGRVARTGVSERTEQFSGPVGIWVDTFTFKVGEEGNKVALVFQDVTVRKRREANLAFLAKIADDLSRLSTAEEILKTVGAKIGAHLQVESCLFVDVDDARGEVYVLDSWSSPGVPGLRHQTIRLSDFINEEFARTNRSGEGAVVRDTQTDLRAKDGDYSALGIRSFVTIPFHHNGVWTNYLAITQSQPRDWRDDEVELFRELANCIFPRLERARTEEALRQLEERNRIALEAAELATWEWRLSHQ